METIVAATSALVLLSAPEIAAAQGLELFGDAFVGLGYNIDNEGAVLFDDEGHTPDTLRAISQVRFGVEMAGETDSGIVFGAEIRADNAEGGEGGQVGQVEGSVFLSGDWGTVTFGDADAADQQWVGDVPGNFSLTGLTDISDTKFISNGGSFGDDSGETFAENPFARPTVRYDLVLDDFGISLSTNRDLTDLGIGAGFSADLAGGTWNFGIGYYNFASFVDLEEEGLVSNDFGIDGDITSEAGPDTLIPAGEQWSLGLGGEFEYYSVGITYTHAISDSKEFGRAEADDLLLGASVTLDALSIGAFYGKVLAANGGPSLEILDGDDGYGVTAQYELGEGAFLNGGIVNSYSIGAGGLRGSSATIADFGITLDF